MGEGRGEGRLGMWEGKGIASKSISAYESLVPIIMKPDQKEGIDNLIFGEIQLLLAEKRTALSTLRAGIAVFALPLSVLSVLVATSKYYQPDHVLHFLIPLLLLNGALVALGCFLVFHSVKRIRHYDRSIKELKRKHSAIAPFLD